MRRAASALTTGSSENFALTLKADSTVHNVTRDVPERLGSLILLQGKTQTSVPEIKAGDLGAVAKLKENGARRYEVIDAECVGCNLCMHVCPVPDCITMVPVDTGKPYLNWTQDPRNPHRKAAE